MSLETFATPHYQTHNNARLRHLGSLGLPLDGRRVLEVGSGPGDHTGFYVQRGCKVVSIDARSECIELLQAKFPRNVLGHVADLNKPLPDFGKFDVVHCYGLLYHLEQPKVAIDSMADACSDLLLLETCVSLGKEEALYFVAEDATCATQASTGKGCRPTRLWVLNALREKFSYVYQTRTQPNHFEFPCDWSIAKSDNLTRAVFVASHQPLGRLIFSETLLDKQEA